MKWQTPETVWKRMQQPQVCKHSWWNLKDILFGIFSNPECLDDDIQFDGLFVKRVETTEHQNNVRAGTYDFSLDRVEKDELHCLILSPQIKGNSRDPQ